MSRKSKQKIVQSILELMKENHFNSITISAISENSGLVRKTFYNNFSTKEEVLSFACLSILEESLQQSTILQNPTVKNMAFTFFSIGKKNKDFLKLLRKHNKFHLFARGLHSLTPEIGQFIITDRLNDLPESDKLLVYNFHAAGLLKLLESSLDNELIDNPEKLSDLYTFILKENN